MSNIILLFRLYRHIMQNLFLDKIKYTLILVTIFSFSLILSSCSSTPEGEDDSTENMSAEEIYLEAKGAMDDGNYDFAVDLFEKLEVKFPYGPFAKQAKLDIIYAYFRYDNLESAIIAADRFIKLFPNHPHVDYAYYMQGVCRYVVEPSFIDLWFNQDATERDPETARQAFSYFNQLIRKFPKSIYNEDAKNRMLFIRNNLAKHEIHVAKYYLKRRAYVAAANRSIFVITNYQSSPSVKDALEVMIDAYTKLNLTKLAEDAQRVYDKNYPG